MDTFRARYVLPYLYALTFGILLFVAVPTYAISNFYWVGAGAGSTDFNLGTNWSAVERGTAGSDAPGATGIAVLSYSGSIVSMTATKSVNGLIINKIFTGSFLQNTYALTVGTGGIRMGSGRFLGGRAAITDAGAFVMTGGIIRLNSSNLTISGSLSITKGSASPNASFTSTGTIIFDGTADQTVTIGSTASTFFQNITLNNTGTSSADDLIINASGFAFSGTLTITQGNFDLDDYTVNLRTESGIILADNAEASLVSDGNLTVSGSIRTGASATFTMSGTNTLKLNGVDQWLDTNGETMYSLIIASSSGTTLASNQLITGNLQVNTGATLDLGAFALAATSATITNYGTIVEHASSGTGFISHAATNLLLTDSAYAEDSSFAPGDRLYITITDADENINGTAADTVSVTVTAGSDSETVTLTETSNTSGIFRGSIANWADQTNVVPTASNSKIETTGATTVTVAYTDAQDAGTNSDTATIAAASTSSTASTTTATGGGGGGTRGANTATSDDEGDEGSAGADLPQESGNLKVDVGGKTVVFKDIGVDTWFAPYIFRLIGLGIISGYKDARGNPTGEFKPANSITYGEAAKMAAEAAGIDEVSSLPKNRSARGSWSKGYVAALEAKGVTIFADASLDVNAPAPRGAVVQMILEAYGRTMDTATGSRYSDVAVGSAYADAVETATANGIVSGDDGKTTFRPLAPVNRAEVAKIVDRSIEKYGE